MNAGWTRASIWSGAPRRALRGPGAARDREQLERVAELAPPAEVLGLEAHDALGEDVLRPEPRAERELREDAELLRGVAARDVEGRVGLGVAEPLRLARAPSPSGSPCSAIAVRMKFVVPLTMPWSALMRSEASASRSVRMMGTPPQTARLVVDVDALLAGEPEDLVAARGEERLVGGDDVLAALERAAHELEGLRPRRR